MGVATVTSAAALDNDQQFEIAKKLQKLTGAKNIKLKPKVDASLISGMIIQYGKGGSALGPLRQGTARHYRSPATLPGSFCVRRRQQPKKEKTEKKCFDGMVQSIWGFIYRGVAEI